MEFVDRLLGGRLGQLEKANIAQQVDLVEFPATFTFGTETITLRHFGPEDRAAMLTFARALPEHDLLFLRRDVTKEENVDAWLRDVAEGNYATIVAFAGDEIAGYATVASDGMTWTRHVAELRLQISPRLRGLGLGQLLIEQAFALARERGIRKMMAQMTIDQKAAVRGFERLGFEKEAILRGQVMDRDGGLHDLLIMGLDVERFRASLDHARIHATTMYSEWPSG
jgi:L-amino acid N-acyltransferase YncA